MIERIYYRVKLNTDQIIYSQYKDLEAKLNENIIKDPSKTYLVWKGDKFPNSSNATFKAPEGCTIDWGDGNVETFETASTAVNTHTYTDGFEYHLISLSNYTVVDSNSFSYCSGLTSVTIGNSVTSISDNAFRDCIGLTSIIIPDGVTSIGENAFFGCSGLTSVIIPNSVTGMDYQAFYNCSSLTSVTISDSVTTISFATFSGCIGLTSVTIGNSVRNIGDSAFENCSGLTSVTIPDSVTFMGDYAFFGCSKLKIIKISAINPPTLGSDAFAETPIEKIIVPKSSIDAYKSADGWSTYADKIVYEVDSSDLKNALVINLENGAGTGSIQQRGITYDKLITDYEPNMAAWIIAKNGNTVPANVSVYLTALGNDTVPTGGQVVDILNNHKNDVNTVIANFKTLPSPYENYGIDSLIAGALAGYGLTSSSDLSNIVGKVGSAAAILGAMNKAFSPGAFAGGVGCEAGDEGYPGNSVCSFAFGSNVKTKGICSVGIGRDLDNLGYASAVFGSGDKEYKIDGEADTDKDNQRRYLDNLAEAGGTVTGTGDDRVGVTGINKGSNNFMAGNCHYIGDGADNNAVVGNQNIIGKKYSNSNNANNIVSGSINYIDLSISCGIIGDCNQLRSSFNSLLIGNYLKASSCKAALGAGQYNAGVGDDTRFFVGNGTSDNDRKNAFEVLQDGRAKVQTAPTENNDVVRKLELDRKFDKAGGTVTGDMVVGGNLTVQGKTTTVDSETLRVADKLIEVGKGNTAPLTSPAGLITPKYDGTNNGGIVYDHTGTAYVGDISLDSNGNVDVNNSDLQPIATRNATIINGNLVKWDGTNHKLIDAGKNVESFVDKSYADNLNARYVSTSILGG